MTAATPKSHPAKFTDVLLPKAVEMLDPYFPVWCSYGLPHRDALLLDPFAGTGKGVVYMTYAGFVSVGIELEPEWADEAANLVEQGNALELPYGDNSFDVIFTSPCYGNRMADKDMRPSVAGTYAKSLGRHASDGSSCHLQWGDEYREFHEDAWEEATRVLKRGGYFLLNIKDHYRNGELQGVPEWHDNVLEALGYSIVACAEVECPGNRRGANGTARVDFEYLTLFRLDTK